MFFLVNILEVFNIKFSSIRLKTIIISIELFKLHQKWKKNPVKEKHKRQS